jgi:hypothetical protein
MIDKTRKRARAGQAGCRHSARGSPAAKASISGLTVAYDRLSDDDRRNLVPPREQLFHHLYPLIIDHLNPLLVARYVSVESYCPH